MSKHRRSYSLYKDTKKVRIYLYKFQIYHRWLQCNKLMTNLVFPDMVIAIVLAASQSETMLENPCQLTWNLIWILLSNQQPWSEAVRPPLQKPSRAAVSPASSTQAPIWLQRRWPYIWWNQWVCFMGHKMLHLLYMYKALHRTTRYSAHSHLFTWLSKDICN